MKEKKREYMPLYSLYDRNGIAGHLEKMAAKGWLLEKMGTYTWQYRRIEPKALHFSVTYFPKATQFDPYPAEGLETFREFCAEAGWILTADSGQVQVFYNEDPDATPIETDPEAEFHTIHDSMKRGFLASYWFFLFLSIFELGFFVWRLFEDPIDQFSSALQLNAAFGFLPLALLTAAELIRYYRWRKRCRMALELGDPLPEIRSARWLSILILILAGIQIVTTLLASLSVSRAVALTMAFAFIFIFAIIAWTNSIRKTLQKLHVKAWVNMAVTISVIILLTVGMMGGLMAVVFRAGGSWLEEAEHVEYYEVEGLEGHRFRQYRDKLPLTVQDLMPIPYDNWSTQLRREDSPLLTHIEASQRGRVGDADIPGLSYDLLLVKAGFLYDLCRQEYIDWLERDNDQIPEEYWEEYRPVDSAPWNAAEVYQRYSSGEPINQFLVCWPDRIAEIHLDWNWVITSEMISVIASHLQGIE